jgi:hypothetical protein
MDNKQKYILIGLGSVVVLILLVIFAPLFWLKSFAENEESNVLREETLVTSYNPFSPEVVIFSQDENYEVSTTFLSVKRESLIWWEVESSETLNSKVESHLSDEDKEIQADENIMSLQDAINSGELTKEKVKEYTKDNPNTTNQYDSVDETNTEQPIVKIESNDGSHTVELKSDGFNSYLVIDDKKVEGMSSIASPTISTDSKYVYYTSILSTEDEDHGDENLASGVIYRLYIDTLKEEFIFDFKQQNYMTLAANEEALVYVFNTGEVGKIDLKSKERTLIANLEVLDYTDPSEIIYIDDEVVKIIPNTPQYLNTGEVEIKEYSLNNGL